MPAEFIEAAGGVLWRRAPGGRVETCLVHRPKYDDWSIPKGKLDSGEHPLLGALREVWEETGCPARPGRPLGEIRYLKDGSPKRVRYWAMSPTDGAADFVPTAEVDQLMWLPPREGQLHLLPDRDRRILADYAADTRPTQPLILLRHGSAGERAAWSGDDRDRPLDALGRAQAHGVVPLLEAFGVTRVLCADVARCLETVTPFATAHRITVHSEPLLSETGFAGDPGAAVARFTDICAETVLGEGPTVVCSQGRAIPGLVAGVVAALGGFVPTDLHTRKGAFWVLHVADGPGLAGLEGFPAPAG